MIRPNAFTVFTVALFSLAAACNVDRLGNMVENADKRTFAPGEAIGAVNYQRNDSSYWDQHVNRCRLDDSGVFSFSLGDSAPALKLNAAGTSAYAFVYPPDGPVRFERSQCDTFNFAAPSAKQPGKETLICRKNGARLNTTIRFGACSR
ncbi:MAG TPA: hypothetical protein VKX25_08760 [Bryobacteraceae bacterium]|nr:hypothetical protein [Bryobacteraceae bacterium]